MTLKSSKVRQVGELYHKGESITRIAERLGVSRPTVYKYLDIEVKRNARSFLLREKVIDWLYKQGGAEAIIEVFDESKNLLERCSHRIFWKEAIKELYKEGGAKLIKKIFERGENPLDASLYSIKDKLS